MSIRVDPRCHFEPGDLDPDAPTGFSFAYIPAGTHQAGSPVAELGRYDSAWGSNETQHWVELTRAFWIRTTEATQAQWQELAGTNPS
jgi:formylglycine-generating enzyme required for sulfatase activity